MHTRSKGVGGLQPLDLEIERGVKQRRREHRAILQQQRLAMESTSQGVTRDTPEQEGEHHVLNPQNDPRRTPSARMRDSGPPPLPPLRFRFHLRKMAGRCLALPQVSAALPRCRYYNCNLLTEDPHQRLGAKGATEVKQHPFFRNINWDTLARQKAAFVSWINISFLNKDSLIYGSALSFQFLPQDLLFRPHILIDVSIDMSTRVLEIISKLDFVGGEEDGEQQDGAQEKLEVYWDDGYGTQTVKDYLELAKEIIKPDGGPPRWFAPVSCGPHLHLWREQHLKLNTLSCLENTRTNHEVMTDSSNSVSEDHGHNEHSEVNEEPTHTQLPDDVANNSVIVKDDRSVMEDNIAVGGGGSYEAMAGFGFLRI
nr:acyltransferase-like protein At1g54570, chloroplastic isoform X1 [Ipomoea batatas]